MRGAARVEEELNRRAEKKDREVLWQKSAIRSKAIRVRVVHRGSNSNVCAV